MKHLTIALCLLPLFAIAQEQKKIKRPQLEFSVGYGRITTSQINEALHLKTLDFDGYSYEGEHFFGAILVSASRFSANKRYRFGVTLGYDVIRGRYTETDVWLNLQNYHSRHITVATEASVAYIKRHDFRFYGLAGIGLTHAIYNHYPDNGKKFTKGKNFFNVQLTPIGFALGEEAGAFVELGYGYKGLINAGIFARF